MKRAMTALAMMAALPGSVTAIAETSCTEDAIVVFDGSASMRDSGEGLAGVPRIVAAREAMHRAMPLIPMPCLCCKV